MTRARAKLPKGEKIREAGLSERSCAGATALLTQLATSWTYGATPDELHSAAIAAVH